MEPKKRGPPITALWRYREDGTYDKRALDPNYQTEYNTKYYAENRERLLEHYKQPVVCSLCNTTIVGINKLARHKKSNKCMKIRERLATPWNNREIISEIVEVD